MLDLPRLLGSMLEPLEDRERPVVELSSIKPGIQLRELCPFVSELWIRVAINHFLIHKIKKAKTIKL